MKIFSSLCSSALSAITIAGLLLVALAMPSSSASATVITTKCGQPNRSVVKESYNKTFTTSSTTLVDLPSARVVVNVPNMEGRIEKGKGAKDKTLANKLGRKSSNKQEAVAKASLPAAMKRKRQSTELPPDILVGVSVAGSEL